MLPLAPGAVAPARAAHRRAAARPQIRSSSTALPARAIDETRAASASQAARPRRLAGSQRIAAIAGCGCRGWRHRGLCARNHWCPRHLRTRHSPEDKLSSELIKHISDASFDTDVLKSDKPALVDHLAEWCGPQDDRVPYPRRGLEGLQRPPVVVKMNVDENSQIPPGTFGIRGIPTPMLFKDG